MQLSDAILLSIGTVKEDRSRFLLQTNNEMYGCVIGTGLYSEGVRSMHLSDGITLCHKYWPWTRQSYNEKRPFYCTIAHEISRRHISGESRECIAAWIAGIEPSEYIETRITIKEGLCEVPKISTSSG